MADVSSPSDLAFQAAAASDPRERLRAIAALREELAELERDAVGAAVHAGASWGQVAEALGVSRQSAHKRFAHALGDHVPARRRARPAAQIVVTAQARRAVRAARAAARALGHPSVETSHLLLGLLADREGPAATALEAIGVRFEVASEVVAAQQPRRGRGRRGPRPPFAPAFAAALEQSLHEARRLGHAHLGVEHLLLGMVRDGRGTAVAALGALGVSATDLERCLGKVLMEAPFARDG